MPQFDTFVVRVSYFNFFTPLFSRSSLMAPSNHVTKVAIVGASGNVGSFITSALLKTGKHTITALTRTDSQSRLPTGVISKIVDYSKPQTLISALEGQDALVIALNSQASKGTEFEIIKAAGEAGVKWILPNDWSPDAENEGLVQDVFSFQNKVNTRNAIRDLGKSFYLSLTTGFWYEWSLAIAPAFGIDLLNHTATFFDEGETKISVSTWPQVGRAVAALLSLPIKAEDHNSSVCLDNFKNKVIYVNSFTVSQKDMLESALRVTGTKEEDWKITKESTRERYENGFKLFNEGSRVGYGKMLYSRVFYPDGCGDFEHNKGTSNEALGLPKEDIDEATKAALERSRVVKWE